MRATIDTWTGRLGLLAGFCAVAAWLLLAGPPADAPSPSASIRLSTLAAGELSVAPLGKPVLITSDLRPGTRGESGTVSIRNQTPSTLDVSLRTSQIERELDRSAWIEVADRGHTVLRSPLARARSWSAVPVRLAPTETHRLRARVWIPDGAADGWQAAHGDLTLEFRSSVVTAR